MATKIILPKLGQTMEEGTIVEWLKKEGDRVERDEILFQVESDKAVLEVESKAKGVLRKILVGTGVKVPILTPVAIIGEPDEDISALLAEAGVAEAAPQPEAPAAPAEAPAAAEAPEAPTPAPEQVQAAAPQPVHAEGERIFASPRARKLAEEKDVDLRFIQGTGPNGRIIEQDVLDYLERQPAATPLARKVAKDLGVRLEQVPAAGPRVTTAEVRAAAEQPAVAPAAAPAPQAAPQVTAKPAPLAPAAGEVTKLAGVRAIIAERMSASSQTTAAVTLTSQVDATELVAVRTQLKDALSDELGFAVGYNDLLAVIVARCLKEFPYMNVRLEQEGIRHLQEINIGLAVDSDRGLLVPVIRNADQKSLKALAQEFRALVARAREGKSLPDDLKGGTFTITNLGMFGIDSFSPIINLPECAILGVGRIRPEPAVVNGQVVVRQLMWLSLTFDHRLVDGAPAARFLQGIARYIESPYLLLA